MCVYIFVRDDGKGCQTADEKRKKGCLVGKTRGLPFLFSKRGRGLTWKEVERTGGGGIRRLRISVTRWLTLFPGDWKNETFIIRNEVCSFFLRKGRGEIGDDFET